MADSQMHRCEFVGHRSKNEFPRSQFRPYQGKLEHINQRTRHYDTGGVIIPQPVNIPQPAAKPPQPPAKIQVPPPKKVTIPIPGSRVPKGD